MNNELRFDGSDYVPERDNTRLTNQYGRIFDLMKDGQYRSLSEISEKTNTSTASVSAQLRHMRKERFGKHTINKKYMGDGLYVYQLVVKNDAT